MNVKARIYRFTVKISLLCLLFFFPMSISTQPLADMGSYIKRIDINNISQLTSLIKAKGIKAELKVKSLQRIAELLKENPDKIEKTAKKVIPQLHRVIEQHAQDTQTNFNYQVRQAVCSTLGVFNTKATAPDSVSEIRNLFLNDSHHKVQSSCARALGDFKQTRDLSTKVLLEKINNMLEKNRDKPKITHEESIKIIVTIRSIGKLASKAAFIPLMRILQSGYPVAVKKEAEEAMESIKW